MEDMLTRINVACYKQWEKNKAHQDRNPFKKLDIFTNLAIVLVCALGFVLYWLNSKQSDFISSFLYVFLIFSKNDSMQFLHQLSFHWWSTHSKPSLIRAMLTWSRPSGLNLS
jgi:Ni,Fe-hydrogenase I cytochrome b subunit